MNLPVPIPTVDAGPDWAQQIYNCLYSILDQHNHSPGNGVQIAPNGLNISSDLSFLSNNATNLRSSRYVAQSAPLSGATDVGCVYVSGLDLYYNDISGNHVRMTSGGTVNATSSGISSGTATAGFVSGTLVVDQATNTPGNIQAGSYLLGNNTVGSDFITISPSGTITANYTLTVPAAPPSVTSFLQMDTSGNIAGTIPVSQGITRANLAPVGQQVSSSSGSFSTTSTSPVSVFSSPATATVTGRPVMVIVQGDGSSGQSSITSIGGGYSQYLQLVRDSTTLYLYPTVSSGTYAGYIPSIVFLDTTATAGLHSWELKAYVSNGSITVMNCQLVVYEL
jgi:hypothetical protein